MSFNNRPSFANGAPRAHYYASSKGDISVPANASFKQADKFTSTVNGQCILCFETTTPVLWHDARSMLGNAMGVTVTMCKGPCQELDSAQYQLMVGALRKSDKWTHHASASLASRTTFFQSASGTTKVSPVPTLGTSPTTYIVKAMKREREIIVSSSDEDEVPVPARTPDVVTGQDVLVPSSQEWL